MQMRGNDPLIVRDLRIAAYVVIVGCGIWAASHILNVILLSLLFAYILLPLPKWLMHKYHIQKTSAIIWTVVFMVSIYTFVAIVFFGIGFRLHERLPMYEQHFRTLYGQFAAVTSAYGIQSVRISLERMASSEEIATQVRSTLPRVIGLLSDRILIFLLSLLLLVEMANPEDSATGPLARNLVHYGKDIQNFINVTAKTGAINALANLVVLLVLRVDFPFFWCILYFYLHFLPNIGFLVAMVPPVFVALLMMGWKRALLVALGLSLTQLIVHYWITPMMMKKELDISFLQVTLALMIWGFLLGPVGVVLAVPLTMTITRLVKDRASKERERLEPDVG